MSMECTKRKRDHTKNNADLSTDKDEKALLLYKISTDCQSSGLVLRRIWISWT